MKLDFNEMRNEFGKKKVLNWGGVVFLVLATNGPLTSLIGAVPFGISLGNGIGLPGSFVTVGALYLVFAAGFTAMSRYVQNAGAFYAYVAKGLGRPFGIGAGFMAIASYVAVTLAMYALIGYFVSYAMRSVFVIAVPWWVSAVFAIAVVHYFAYKNLQFSGRVLFLMMACEIVVILVFDGIVIAKGGGVEHFSLRPFFPGTVLTSGFGPSLVFVVASYMGFETTAIYAEEVRDPTRSIPKATYVSIAIIMTLYAGSVWLMANAYGFDEVVKVAARDPGNLWFSMTFNLMGPTMVTITNVLMITSLLAAIISFNNATVRYWFALGRDGIAWRRLEALHVKQKTPYVAANLQTALMLTSVLVFAMFHVDPQETIVPYLSVPSAVGIVGVQALTALAVVYFFWTNHRGVSIWRRLIAPTISFLGFLYFIYAMVVHVDLMVGKDSSVVHVLPWCTLFTAILGVAFAYWLKFKKPMVYENLNRFLSDM